ncbi:MAG: hypothetical protein HY974_00540 [Candidatus Kerfeldbacteria bacterium]|nr:hypothetical protein [Candidatus Kerfeldbacteria bacterium]
MRYIFMFLAGCAVVLLTAVILERQLPKPVSQRLSVSYSSSYARYLKLDESEVLAAIVRDFKPVHFRLQADWSSIEARQGEFDWQEMDRQIAQAAQSGATVTLAIGRKLPHWPECHDPAWLAGLSSGEIDERLMLMLRRVVEHYHNNPSVVRWQLENEPLFAFGSCAPPNIHRLRRELALVRSLDSSRPILLTDSGELSSWWEAASLADELGFTLYRVVWDRAVGYFSHFWPPAFYRLKAALVAPWVGRVVVSELQMEPWGPEGLNNLSLSEARRSFDVARFWDNIKFSRATGMSEAIVWGAEWWYAAKQEGDPSYWQAGQVLFGQPPAR